MGAEEEVEVGPLSSGNAGCGASVSVAGSRQQRGPPPWAYSRQRNSQRWQSGLETWWQRQEEQGVAGVGVDLHPGG